MASSDRQKSAQLLLYDTLSAPRQSVSITADLLEEHFLRNSGVGGELVLFQHEGAPIGQAMTGGDGRAVRSFTPTAIGVTALSARLAPSHRVTAGEATARLFVWERSRPLSLISLHALVSHGRGSGSFLPFSETNAELPDPEPDAVQMLSTVARRNGLIYLIAADPIKLSDLRQWSARHHLPAGPIVLLQRTQGFAHELDGLQRDGWQGIKAGVPTVSREKWPAKTVQAQDWADVAKRLLSA